MLILCYFAGLSHPFLGMGPGPLELGKIAVFRLKLGKSILSIMYQVSIARLIQVVNLTLFLKLYIKLALIIRQYLIQEQFWFHIYLIFSMGIKWEDSN